jgi:hypothetical protein
MVNDNSIPQIWFVWMKNVKNMVLNFDGLMVMAFGQHEPWFCPSCNYHEHLMV